MYKIIAADKFFLKNRVTGPGFLEVHGGSFGTFYKDKPGGEHEFIDWTGYWIAPGLVDTHIHGMMNYDVMDHEPQALNAISQGLLSSGVTSFLPTTLTSSIDQLDRVCQLIGENSETVAGAKVQGIFLEGPFFTEKYKGAQNAKYFCDPSIDTLKKWQELSNGRIRKIAIAPERKGAIDFIDYAVKEGITVALGHSDATYEEAAKAVDQGASVFVHTFNGMRPLHHREPGMAGAAMNLKDVYAELICDGYHVRPETAEILMKSREKKEVILISDSMRAGGMPDGQYHLGEFPVTVKGGTASIKNGSLAGSVLTLAEAVKNVVTWGLADAEEAIYMASTAPAESVHLGDKCGAIAQDLPADFIAISPELELEATYVDGECLYRKGDGE